MSAARTAAARYHVGSNHTAADGMPGLAYTFFLRGNGEVWWCTDLEARTWSQGGRRMHPDVDGDGDVDRDDGQGNANGRFLAIVFGGSFDSRWNRTGQQPTALQITGALFLVAHLTGTARWADAPAELFGALDHLDMLSCWPHAAFGKAACPGERLATLTDWLRGGTPPRSALAWQRALLDLGYDLGRWGTDGDWGSASARALRSFQADHSLDVTGHRDPATEQALFGR